MVRPSGWCVVAVLWASAALAQAEPQPLPQRLYLNPGVLIGSSRMISLGGAYTAIAEGADGISANPASIAHRTPHERGAWQVSPVATWMINLGDHDFDNDGNVDPVYYAWQALGGLQVRVKHLGVGAFLRSNRLSFCDDRSRRCEAGQRIGITFMNPSLSVGYAFLDESLVVAGGINGQVTTLGNNLDTWRYLGVGAEAGVLLRPRGLPFRVGLAARTPVKATYQGGPSVTVLGRQVYEGVVSPGLYSFGISFKAGEGAFSWNELPDIDAPPPSRAVEAGSLVKGIFGHRDDARTGRLLLSLQVDLIQGVSRAVSVGSFIQDEDAPIVAGAELAYQPRVGAEYLVVPGRFRVRLGGYHEPSPYPDRGGRTHVTGGTELFLFRLIDDWSGTFTFDVARNYRNIGLSIGTWRY
jgi:hypothetical protein